MAVTVTITAGANTKTFNISPANQRRILAGYENHGYQRDPDETGTDMNDWDYFLTYFWAHTREMVIRAEAAAAASAVTDDPGLIT